METLFSFLQSLVNIIGAGQLEFDEIRYASLHAISNEVAILQHVIIPESSLDNIPKSTTNNSLATAPAVSRAPSVYPNGNNAGRSVSARPVVITPTTTTTATPSLSNGTASTSHSTTAASSQSNSKPTSPAVSSTSITFTSNLPGLSDSDALLVHTVSAQEAQVIFVFVLIKYLSFLLLFTKRQCWHRNNMVRFCFERVVNLAPLR